MPIPSIIRSRSHGASDLAHPHFICIGAQKAGTGWVYDQFSAHSGYWAHPIKEISFFDAGFGAPRLERATRQRLWRSRDHARGKSDETHALAFVSTMLHRAANPWSGDFSPYFALFDDKPGRCFDCSPGYCRVDADMVRAMSSQMPQTRFFMTIRDPAERLWSQAQMHVRMGRSPPEALALMQAFHGFVEKPEVQALSFVSLAVRTWRRSCDPARYQLYSFDDLRRDPSGFRDRLCAFLGADPAGFAYPADYNKKEAQPGKGPMPADLRRWAAMYLAEEYRMLAALIGGDALRWKARNDAILAA